MTPLIELILEKIPRDFFTDTEIKILLPGASDNRRYSLIKRALAKGHLVRVKRGLYCLGPKFRKQPLNLYEIANIMYGPSYVSFQSALSFHGWIPEAVHTITSASAKRSREFETPLGQFSFNHVNAHDFLAEVERKEEDGGAFFMASPERALLDYVFVYRKNWYGIAPVLDDLRVDISVLQENTFQRLDALAKAYRSHRVSQFIDGLRQDMKK